MGGHLVLGAPRRAGERDGPDQHLFGPEHPQFALPLTDLRDAPLDRRVKTRRRVRLTTERRIQAVIATETVTAPAWCP